MELFNEVVKGDPENLSKLVGGNQPPDPGNKYYHWDKLRHLKSPPKGISHKEWWFQIKLARRALFQDIPHNDKFGANFVFCEPKSMQRLLHEIDLHGGGELRDNAQVSNPATRESYLINSLIEESITSSQLEGAATTRKIAKEMLRTKREPRNRSERMIINNYRAMEYIKYVSDEDLSPAMILELQRILTVDTLDDKTAEGSWRDSNDVYVGDDRDSTIIHEPPNYAELEKRVLSICDFANSKDSEEFLHPVIRATILHFLLAYDHPFDDGNGRTARALFYWSMMRQGYWTMEFVSISRILKLAPSQYTRSYLYTETDDNDVTYFILHQLSVILRAVKELISYLERKTKERQKIEEMVRNSSVLNNELNHRQTAIIDRALKDPNSVFTIESHRGSHNVTYDTARTDLLRLVKLKLFEKTKRGRAFVFTPIKNFEEALTSV